jgi:mannose-6-phosphate isomerase-like protein (cupin superfamily)
MVEKKEYGSRSSGATLEVRELPTGDSHELVVGRLLRPGMGFVLPHVHLDFDETFTIEDGVADAWVEGKRLRLGPQDVLVIRRGEVHMNPRNRSGRDLVFSQQFTPPTRDAVRYVEALADVLEDGRDVRGDLPPLTAMALMPSRKPQTFAPLVPQAVQRRAVFPVARRLQCWREERRLLAEEERRAVRASQYGYWPEDHPRLTLRRRPSAADGGSDDVAEAS